MATLAPNNPNLLDWARSIDPDGNTADVVELLNQANPMLEVLPFVEGNLPTGHQTTLRVALPSSIWRELYQGTPASKSARAQITETCGLLEARSEVDVKLANLNGNSASFRLSEAMAFVESISQTMASTVWYGNVNAGSPFNGLAPRYNSLSGTVGVANVVSAGGTGSTNTSIWLVVLGEQTVHGIFPKGSKAGLQHRDLGEIDAFDGNNNRFRAYADLWQWDVGLVVRDWRAVVRIANIPAADLLTAGLASGTQAASAATNVLRLLLIARNRIPAVVRGRGRMFAFMNSRVATGLQLLAMEKSQNALALAAAFEQTGKGFDGIMFQINDAILNTEAQVV